MITVEFDHKQLSGKLKDLSSKRLKSISNSSIKRALSAGQSEMKKELKTEYVIPSGDLKEIKTYSGDQMGRLYITGKRRAFSAGARADRWKATQLKRGGVKIYVKKGAPERLRHAFIATMPSGHQGVFERMQAGGIKRVKRKDAAGKVYYSQLPVREIKGPSLTGLFAAKARMERIKTVMINRYNERMQHELSRLL